MSVVAGGYQPHPATAERLVALVRDASPAHFELARRDGMPRPAYRSPDGAVRQVEHASCPVFLIEDVDGRREVAKFGRADGFVERELERAGRLELARDGVDPVPAAVMHVDGHAVLVSPYVDGTPLLTLAGEDAPLFMATLERVLAAYGAQCARTLEPFDPARAEQTTQTSELLREQLRQLAARGQEPPLDRPLRVGGRELPSLAEVVRRAAGWLERPPTRMAYFNGDSRLDHFLVAPDARRIAAIDHEYVGTYDLDFAPAVPFASCFGDGFLTREERLAPSDDGALEVEFELVDPALAPLLREGWLLERLGDLPLDRERVFARTLAVVNHWLRARWASEDPAAHAKAAAVVVTVLLAFGAQGT